MSQEASWFEAFTWNGERETEIVVVSLTNKMRYDTIKGAVEPYFESLGFKKIAPHSNARNIRNWHLNLSDKTYEPRTFYRCNDTTRIGWPSQIANHMAKHYGTIIGRKFGI